MSVTIDQFEPSGIGINAQEDDTRVFVMCRKDAFYDRWYTVAEAVGAQFSLKEYRQFDNPDAAASEAAKQLFDLTKRFTPIAYRELFEEVRTPETVLRAMLRAYQEAQISAAVRYISSADADEKTAERQYAAMRELAEQVLECLASYLSGVGSFVANSIGHDYRARLAGERPLDAPPLEAP